MIEINPAAFFTRQDLAELFQAAGVDVDTLLARIRPRRVVRGLYLGQDLINAYLAAPALAAEAESAPAMTATIKNLSRTSLGRCRDPKRRMQANEPGAALAAEFIDPLKKSPRKPKAAPVAQRSTPAVIVEV